MLFGISCSPISTNRSPEPAVKMTSDSPNGKFRCVVKEQLPPKGYYSPYVYIFTIKDLSTGQDLKGDPFEDNTDSVSLSNLKFDWNGNEVKVSFSEPARHFLTGKISGNEQQWTPIK
jgi:hypothetical protein